VARAGVFAEEARPVARLYVLEYDAALRTPVIEPMTATDALPWLSANTFAQRVLSREQRAEEFSALADLVASVPVRRLRRPDTIAHLAATTAAVRRDATPADASASKRIAAYGRTFDVRIVDRPEGPAPIEITERYVSAFRTGADRPMLRAGLTANGSHVLDYWDGTRCTIDARGQQLFLESPPRVGDPDEFLFGLGLAFALRLRGELCVHAAAVNINGEAVLLAGLPRAGKSTFAAALQALGQQALTDDVCVLDLVRGRPFVQAGPRRLRLRADTTELLERALGHPMTFVQAPDGRQVDVLLPRGDQAAPVRGIYWLDRTAADGEAPRIQLLSAADAVIKLVSDTWGARLLDREMRQQEFDRACRVIACVRTRIVRYANGPAGLADAARELVREVVEAQGVE
jgi:hypothetical protein